MLLCKCIEETCQDLDILMVWNSSIGMQILLISASNHSSQMQNDSMNISNHYLSPECGDKNRCDILHFESSGFSYYIIPSIRGFVSLSHGTDLLDYQTSFISVAEECNPTQAFYDEYSNNIAIACMNLQTRPHGIMYYLPYHLALNNDGRRGLIIRNTELVVQSEPIYNPETVSKVIHVRGQEACAEYDNLYFVDDAYVLHYPFDAFDSEFIQSNQPLLNCIGFSSIEYYGNDELLIRCSNGQTILYDSCASEITDTFSSSSTVPYPCTNWDYVVYKNKSHLVLKSNGKTLGTLELPFSDLTYGKCVHHENSYLTFIGSSADGTTFIASFSGADERTMEVFESDGDWCIGDNKTSCPKPVFSDDEKAIGIFYSVAENIVIVNLTQTRIIVNVSRSFTPELISISQRKTTYNCSYLELRPQTSDLTTVAASLQNYDVMTQPLFPVIPVVVGVVIVIVMTILSFILVVIV